MSSTAYSCETFNEVTLREHCWHMNWNEFRPPRNRPVTPSFALFRMLLGGVVLEFSGSNLIQRNNYMSVDTAARDTPFFYGKLKAAFPTLGEQNRAGDFLIVSAMPALRKYFAEPGGNHGFFNSIFDEIARAIWYLNNHQGLSAFVHLYRAFEKLSFSFPLYYARRNNSYMKAYEQLKGYFKGGELDFCSNFIREILGEDSLTSADIRKLKFSSPLTRRQLAYFSDHHKSISISGTHELEIKIIDVFDFIVKTRNHYFHHLAGSNYSLESTDIPRSDEFFMPLTEVGIGLIGVIFGKMVVNAI